MEYSKGYGMSCGAKFRSNLLFSKRVFLSEVRDAFPKLLSISDSSLNFDGIGL